ncbi:MAG: toprim domain-containing protein [Aquabacterium sp.]
MLIPGVAQALSKRGISEETCRFFGYTVGKDPKTGRTVQLAPYFDENRQMVAQKWRTADKDFGVVGKLKNALPLFGQHLWRERGKKVVVTEGEIDCMSVSQMQNNKWPVVSVPTGAKGAKKVLGEALEWLLGFEEIILMFDMDEEGRRAVDECAPLFPPGRCKVATLPLKDANEMLKAGRGGEIISAIWDAKDYRPDGIRTVDELAEEAELDIPWGRPWWMPSLDQLTFGRRDGEIYAFGAGTGVGKTDWFTQSIAYDILELGLKVGVLYLEQPCVETLRRVAGKAVGKVLHVPGKATREERREAISLIKETQSLFLYDSFGPADWEVVKTKIRYLAVGLGCKHIYLDHLTALVASEDDERKVLDKLMAELAKLALDLKVCIHFISHLTRPEGKPHEEGGRVQIRHFRGSNAIGMWSHFMFGLERDQTVPGSPTTFRVLKDRNTGQATGNVIGLDYDPTTGLLSECPLPEEDERPRFPDRTQKQPTEDHDEF